MRYIKNAKAERAFAERRLLREANWSSVLEKTLLEITEVLAKKMSSRRVSRSQLAEMLGTSRSYISQIMSGFPNMKLSTLFKLSFVLGLRPRIVFDPMVSIEENEFKAVSRRGTSIEKISIMLAKNEDFAEIT